MEKKKVSIALQGGGAHGAFAWGVMDRLLEDGRFDICGISGTSAGGMNAACVIQGLLEGDEQTARHKLETYWRRVCELSANLKGMPGLHDVDADFLNSDSKLFSVNHDLSAMMMGYMMMFLSPAQMNPFNDNIFLDFLKGFFNFDAFKSNLEKRIFLAATHVKSGKIKIFSNNDMSADVLMASACLPHLFHTVYIDGEPYWDGGFIANPAIYPLMDLEARDIIVVQLTKTYCDEVPTKKQDIVDRLKEITYNGCLVREMRAIYFISKLIDDGIVEKGKLPRFNMHMIKSEDTFKKLRLSSATNPRWDFMCALKEEGRKAAQQWIDNYGETVGKPMDSLNYDFFNDFI
ncbi:MAG: patatin-like phospholipase family protein [Alphaproteobacteria bacterium]|nr:patatin-like phospholipase family protein [Alphaproteobacteria bacterium]